MGSVWVSFSIVFFLPCNSGKPAYKAVQVGAIYYSKLKCFQGYIVCTFMQFSNFPFLFYLLPNTHVRETGLTFIDFYGVLLYFFFLCRILPMCAIKTIVWRREAKTHGIHQDKSMKRVRRRLHRQIRVWRNKENGQRIISDVLLGMHLVSLTH